MKEKREKIDKNKPGKRVNQEKKKSAKIKTSDDNLSGLFGGMKELFPPSTETAYLSNDELYARFIEGRLFNPLISDSEKAGLALIHRLRGDYEHPLFVLKIMYDPKNGSKESSSPQMSGWQGGRIGRHAHKIRKRTV